MTRKATLTVILMSMAISAVIVIMTVSSSVKRQRIKAESIATQTETETKPIEVGYYLKAYEGEVAVFRGESQTPFKKLGVSMAFMSDQDKILLTDGIFVQTEKELNSLIEDYAS